MLFWFYNKNYYIVFCSLLHFSVAYYAIIESLNPSPPWFWFHFQERFYSHSIGPIPFQLVIVHIAGNNFSIFFLALFEAARAASEGVQNEGHGGEQHYAETDNCNDHEFCREPTKLVQERNWNIETILGTFVTGFIRYRKLYGCLEGLANLLDRGFCYDRKNNASNPANEASKGRKARYETAKPPATLVPLLLAIRSAKGWEVQYAYNKPDSHDTQLDETNNLSCTGVDRFHVCGIVCLIKATLDRPSEVVVFSVRIWPLLKASVALRPYGFPLN
jgi:hypothetical protein